MVIDSPKKSIRSVSALPTHIAAERGYIDAAIEPSQTRAKLFTALRFLETKRDADPQKKRGIPRYRTGVEWWQIYQPEGRHEQIGVRSRSLFNRSGSARAASRNKRQPASSCSADDAAAGCSNSECK